MSGLEFIERLKEICPSRSNLIREGFEGRFLDVISSGYNLPLKDSTSLHSGEGIIIGLVNDYDVSYIRFGDYSFEKDIITNNENSKVFCTSSGTYIAIEPLNGDIVEFDKDDNSLIQRCALNEVCFLNSLLFILQLKSLKLQGETSSNWQNFVDNLFAKAIEASGGNMYKNFLKQFFEN